MVVVICILHILTSVNFIADWVYTRTLFVGNAQSSWAEYLFANSDRVNLILVMGVAGIICTALADSTLVCAARAILSMSSNQTTDLALLDGLGTAMACHLTSCPFPHLHNWYDQPDFQGIREFTPCSIQQHRYIQVICHDKRVHPRVCASFSLHPCYDSMVHPAHHLPHRGRRTSGS